MSFDIDRYKARAGRLDDRTIDYGAFADQPLEPAALRCIRYMHDVEHHTTCYLRDLLVTRAHRDPDLTAFMTCWSYEELWHGEALGRVLAAHGEDAGTPRVRLVRARPRIGARLNPLVMSLASAATAHVTAIHMTWGAINEWTTQAGYGRLAQRARHPVLSALLRQIMQQEGRHIDFYVSQAEERLGASPRAQRLARASLRHLWAPVGASIMPRQEVTHLISWLFAGPAGEAAAARIDRRIDRLPGLAGLDLIATTRARHVDRHRRSLGRHLGVPAAA